MELLKGIIAEDLFIYLVKHETFVISDIHVGYEESLHRNGILIPKGNYNELMLRLEKALEKLKKEHSIKQIVINGDLIHEFGRISRKEKDLVNKLVDFMSQYALVTIIEGNHDKILRYIINKDIVVKDKVVLGDVLIIHGDKIPPKALLKKIKTIIIGHEHPAITLDSGTRTEKYKCFIKGRYEHKDLIVTPSCNILIEGTDILREKLLSPILKKTNLKNSEVYIIEDKIYDFGKIKNLLKE